MSADPPRRRRWREDPYVFKQVKIFIDTFLDYFKPKGRAITPRHHREFNIGKRTIVFEEPYGQKMAEHIKAGMELMARDPEVSQGETFYGLTMTQLGNAGWLLRSKRSAVAEKLAKGPWGRTRSKK
jgi:hypothetical protein